MKLNIKEDKINKNITSFCERFELQVPIIQAGMVWVSGAKLASACANNGIMGTIGAGSMNLELLESQLQKALELTDKNNHQRLAINLPLLYGKIEKQIELALRYNIKNFITSAGSPNKFTQFLKEKNKNVIHVTSSVKLAKKCELAGVDAVVVEGFEAGGHNGREETTSMVLIPSAAQSLKIPIIAAGGICEVNQIQGAHILGASAIQIGSRFVATKESSAHQNFKESIINAKEGETKLLLKKHVPVRLLKNDFSNRIEEMETLGRETKELVDFLGKGRAKSGMLEGDLKNGELEIGQNSSMIKKILPASELINEFKSAYKL